MKFNAYVECHNNVHYADCRGAILCLWLYINHI